MWHSFVLEQIISFSRKKKFSVFFSHKLNKWANKLEKKKNNIFNFYCTQILNYTHGSFSFMSSFCNTNVLQKQQNCSLLLPSSGSFSVYSANISVQFNSVKTEAHRVRYWGLCWTQEPSTEPSVFHLHTHPIALFPLSCLGILSGTNKAGRAWSILWQAHRTDVPTENTPDAKNTNHVWIRKSWLPPVRG